MEKNTKSNNGYFSTLFHGVGTIYYILILMYSNWLILKLNAMEELLKVDAVYTFIRFYPFYLTGWNVLFQSVFFVLALSNDILEWAGKQKEQYANKIRYYRDVLYTGVVVPYTMFVSIMFWGIYAIDRELVFPKVYDEVVPWWFNHCVHTNITVMVIAETFMQPRRNPVNRKLELSLNCFVGVAYAAVYYTIYFVTNRWLYLVFSVMTWWQIVIFQICIWLSGYLFYVLLFPIGRLIHGEEIKEKH